jgi:WD40 repeat protein
MPDAFCLATCSGPSALSKIAKINTFFSPEGALVVTGGQGAMTRVWTLGNEEQTLSFRGMALNVRAATWIKKRTLLVTSAPMQLTLWDVARGHMLRQLQTKDIDGWPMACHESGVCAWTDANNINVKNLLTDGSVHTFSIGNDSAIGIDVAKTAKLVEDENLNCGREDAWIARTGCF